MELHHVRKIVTIQDRKYTVMVRLNEKPSEKLAQAFTEMLAKKAYELQTTGQALDDIREISCNLVRIAKKTKFSKYLICAMRMGHKMYRVDSKEFRP